jgi:hypothetical protein
MKIMILHSSDWRGIGCYYCIKHWQHVVQLEGYIYIYMCVCVCVCACVRGWVGGWVASAVPYLLFSTMGFFITGFLAI